MTVCALVKENLSSGLGRVSGGQEARLAVTIGSIRTSMVDTRRINRTHLGILSVSRKLTITWILVSIWCLFLEGTSETYIDWQYLKGIGIIL